LQRLDALLLVSPCWNSRVSDTGIALKIVIYLLPT
jgi:hypothetical protein